MSFRSVTMNDLERRNGRYFALFQRIHVVSGRTALKFTFAISSPDEFLLYHFNREEILHATVVKFTTSSLSNK